MSYFITGATGFIGKRLVRRLLDSQRDGTIYFLVRNASQGKIDALLEYWDAPKGRCVPVVGDLTANRLGLDGKTIDSLRGKIKHFFHLAAIYDLSADEASQVKANIEGTANAIELANVLNAGCFHHTSSIAAAGLYDGEFTEKMFDEAKNLPNAYYRTKHDSEGLVRKNCTVAWRVYRPAIVVGDSVTGEMDKIDGPYYLFKTLRGLKQQLPSWLPAIGINGGFINIVPVDYVVNAMEHIAHKDGLNGQTFHLVDPHPKRVGDVVNLFAKAAGAPQMRVQLNSGVLNKIPDNVKAAVMENPPAKKLTNSVLNKMGLPESFLSFVNYPTRFDSINTTKALKGSGIQCPSLTEYAAVLWNYWDQRMDPDIRVDKKLARHVKGKVVLITGGSSGIGLATAQKMAAAGAITVICGRDEDKLKEAADLVASRGFELHTYPADIANMEDCDRFVSVLLKDFGRVDILVNNAGRSIRRSIENSFDRFHDLDRTIQLNYLGALRVTYGLLPAMIKKRAGQVINISSIGVLTNAPRFSAYVASKAALDAWTRCAASEFADVGIKFTTINMPLVRTPMIAPTKLYNNVPTLSPEDAADLIGKAIIDKPVRIATGLGLLGQVTHAFTPKWAQMVMNKSFRMFSDSDAAKKKMSQTLETTNEQKAMQTLLKGVHF